jgi:ATP/maltotriose-dependent transcriptional regulator MalT
MRDRPVTVVEAPGGSGKTAMLSDFVAACDGPAIRVTLDDRVSDTAGLAVRFADAASETLPAFKVEVTGKESAPAIADSLADACTAAGARAVVLDDLQYVPSGSELAGAIERLTSRLCGTSRVVLSGSLVPLPRIAELVVQQQVRPRDLACHRRGCAALPGLGVELTLDDAAPGRHHGGLAAALRPAGRSSSKGSRLAAGIPAEWTCCTSSSLRAVRRTSDDTRNSSTALFYSPLMCRRCELLGRRMRRGLEGLVHSTAPVETVDDQPDAYRYRRVFRAFLVSRLRFTEPELFQELNLKAALISERALKWEEALYHVIQAGAWDRIVEIIEKVAPRMFEEGRFDSLSEWLEGVPDEALAAQPRLLLWKARSLHYLNQVDRALAMISQATELFEVRDEPLGLAEALMAKGMSLRVKGDYSDALDTLLKARSLLPEGSASAALTAELRKELGMTLSRCGALNEAIQELTAVVSFYESIGDQYNIAHTIGELAASLAFTGRLAETIVYLERARTVWEELGNGHFLVQTLNNLGMSYYLQGDLPKAEAIFQQGLEQARSLDNMKEQVYLATCIADVKKDAGDYRAAIEMYTASLDDAWAVTDAYIRVYLMDALADAQAHGDITDASQGGPGRGGADGGDLNWG